MSKEQELDNELRVIKQQLRAAVKHIKTLVREFPMSNLKLKQVFALNFAEEYLKRLEPEEFLTSLNEDENTETAEKATR